MKAALKRSRRMEKKERRARPLDAGDEIKGTKWTGGKRKAEIEEFDKPSNQLACLNSDTGSYPLMLFRVGKYYPIEI